MSDKELTDYWTKKLRNFYLDLKNYQSRIYVKKRRRREMDWFNRPIQILLENGTWLTPQQDDEGNDGGSISTNFP